MCILDPIFAIFLLVFLSTYLTLIRSNEHIPRYCPAEILYAFLFPAFEKTKAGRAPASFLPQE